MAITINSSRITGVLLALTVLLAGAAAPALAADPTVDTEATDTTTQSALNDGDTQDTFNASEDVNLSTLQFAVDSQNPGLKIVENSSGDVVKTLADSRFTETGNASGTYYYNVTLSEDEFATIGMAANEDEVPVDLRMVNDTSLSNPDTANITVYFNNTGERAVVRAGSTATDDGGIAEVEEMDLTWAQENIFSTDAANTSVLESDNVGINGSDTDVYVVYADSGVAEPYEDAAEEKSSFFGLRSSDYEDGDKILDHVILAEDTYYYSYSAEAPEDVVDDDDASYAEYMTLNGEPTHKLVLGDEDFEDEDSIDVTTKGNLEVDTGFLGEDIKSYEDTGILASFGMQASAVPGLTGAAAA